MDCPIGLADTKNATPTTYRGMVVERKGCGNSYSNFGTQADLNFGIHLYVDGAPTDAVQIDTSLPGTHSYRLRRDRPLRPHIHHHQHYQRVGGSKRQPTTDGNRDRGGGAITSSTFSRRHVSDLLQMG
jgi:hypothetical protein